ncbi:hypothetical protein [Nonomuraea maheshkhaliensis]|uniref:hypothetical protein n=1 Tax=Nonomuraea maheshkhaliensis TaxID=419590 RepID=UPI0031F7A0BB
MASWPWASPPQGGEHGRERAIGFNHDIGGTGYRSGGLIGRQLNKGKTWWKDSHRSHLWHTEMLGYDEQLINPAELACTRTLTRAGLVSRVRSTFTFAGGVDELAGGTVHVDTPLQPVGRQGDDQGAGPSNDDHRAVRRGQLQAAASGLTRLAERHAAVQAALTARPG